MKVNAFLQYLRRRNILYIPHGSDESKACRLIYSSPVTFISHMVQMKALQKD